MVFANYSVFMATGWLSWSKLTRYLFVGRVPSHLPLSVANGVEPGTFQTAAIAILPHNDESTCHCEPLLPLCLFTRVVKQSKLLADKTRLWQHDQAIIQEMFVNTTHLSWADSSDCFVPRNDKLIVPRSLRSFVRTDNIKKCQNRSRSPYFLSLHHPLPLILKITTCFFQDR